MGSESTGVAVGSEHCPDSFRFHCCCLRKWVAVVDSQRSAWSVIALLAFASRGQIAMARTVDVPEVTAAMVTAAMVTSAPIDLLVDPERFQLNRPGNWPFLFVCFLLLASFIGASAYRYVGSAFSLLLSALCKAAICIAFLFNRPAVEKRHPSKAAKWGYPEILERRFIELWGGGQLHITF
jgi:cellulose synthase/poly-beta-1,6-N-acetylglucosamine synthase-like glycosyltransferase